MSRESMNTVWLVTRWEDPTDEIIGWADSEAAAQAEADRLTAASMPTVEDYQREYLDLPSKPGKWTDDYRIRALTFEEWARPRESYSVLEVKRLRPGE
jgi:hypothetical protein